MRKPSDMRTFQAAGVHYLVGHPAAMLLGDIGVGKTIMALTAIQRLKMMGRTKALVIAPKRVCETVWPVEAAEWSHTCALDVRVATGTPAQREAALTSDADVVCINYENLVMALRQHERDGLLSLFTVLVIDELSFFKNTNTQRYKIMRKHISTFNHRWGLTGTPAPNSLLELFPQTYLLDGGKRFGRTVTHFKNEYFMPVDRYGYRWEPRRGTEEKIYAALADGLAFRVTARDHLEMPTVQPVTVSVPLPDSLMSIYRELARGQLIIVDGAEIFGASEAALGQKLQQLAQGRVYDEDGGAHWVHDFRLTACKDLVSSIGGLPVMIAYHYRHDLDALKKEYPHAPVMSEAANAQELVNDWNRGRVPVLLVHPAAAAHGLNMQGGGHHLIWYCQTWSLELHDQLIGRLVRPGQASDRVIVHYLVSPGTRDVEAVRVLRRKERTQRDLLDALERD